MSVKVLGYVIEHIEPFTMCMFEELGGVNVHGPLMSDEMIGIRSVLYFSIVYNVTFHFHISVQCHLFIKKLLLR